MEQTTTETDPELPGTIIVPIKYVNQLPSKRHYDFWYEDKGGEWKKRVLADPKLDLTNVFRLNGCIYVAYKENKNGTNRTNR